MRRSLTFLVPVMLVLSIIVYATSRYSTDIETLNTARKYLFLFFSSAFILCFYEAILKKNYADSPSIITKFLLIMSLGITLLISSCSFEERVSFRNIQTQKVRNTTVFVDSEGSTGALGRGTRAVFQEAPVKHFSSFYKTKLLCLAKDKNSNIWFEVIDDSNIFCIYGDINSRYKTKVKLPF